MWAPSATLSAWIQKCLMSWKSGCLIDWPSTEDTWPGIERFSSQDWSWLSPRASLPQEIATRASCMAFELLQTPSPFWFEMSVRQSSMNAAMKSSSVPPHLKNDERLLKRSVTVGTFIMPWVPWTENTCRSSVRRMEAPCTIIIKDSIQSFW